MPYFSAYCSCHFLLSDVNSYNNIFFTPICRKNEYFKGLENEICNILFIVDESVLNVLNVFEVHYVFPPLPQCVFSHARLHRRKKNVF